MSVRVAVRFAVKVYKHIKTNLEINEISITFPELVSWLARNSSNGSLKINFLALVAWLTLKIVEEARRQFEKKLT